jgi:hypothetical protein
LYQSVQLPSEIKCIFLDFKKLKERFPVIDGITSLLKINGSIMKLLTFLQMCEINMVSLGFNFILSSKIHFMEIQDLNFEISDLFQKLDKIYEFNYYRLIKEMELWDKPNLDLKIENRKTEKDRKALRKKIKDRFNHLNKIKDKNKYRNYLIDIVNRNCQNIDIFNNQNFDQTNVYANIRKDLSILIYQMNYLDEINLKKLADWKENDYQYKNKLELFFKLIKFKRKTDDLKDPNEFTEWIQKHYLKSPDESIKNSISKEMLDILDEIEIENNGNKIKEQRKQDEERIKEKQKGIQIKMEIDEEDETNLKRTNEFDWFDSWKFMKDLEADKKRRKQK